ncbi:DNA polymerase III [Sorangium cellulosum]|uniref:DNA polymerase beta n=1 Tax=Sorangium cellulosum TaxID=56 RepID=A0A4P2Q4B5_SORCE|nr:DNA polymerase/3'-5' exonuclease PolX [Sorangium cellulosum]AUX23876.1 DNA polymerase III [Sorangium cellulosum]
MENVDIARVFEEVADLLEIQDESPFRVRAYRTAARTLGALGEPVAGLLEREGAGALTALPGIGKDLAGKIVELLETGELSLLKELTAKTPESLVGMMRIPSLGPRRARLLHDSLGVATVDELEEAARSGRLVGVRGFGEKLAATILDGCLKRRATAGRVRLADAEAQVEPLLRHLRAAREALVVEVAGSLRRRKETVGDVDILVCARRGEPVAARLLSYPEIKQVLARGATKCSVVLRSGLQIDLRVVPPASYGAALHYFTGSKAHNITVRTLGVARGLKINEYGVFRGDRRIGGQAEEDVFRAVGLPWIPPELREDAGEIEAARARRLPELVEVGAIRGDLHVHTTYTDGRDELEAMVRACAARGYDYVAITDPTRAVRVAGGLDASGLRRQARAIDRLRRTIGGITILHGAEVDILEDGALDLDDAALAALDYVVASVRSKLTMAEPDMTRRVLRALESPFVTALGHPTGRLLGKREPYALDLPRIARAARDLGVLLEINAQPERLDLCDVHIRLAREAGAKLVVATDAHAVAELDFMRHGIDQARRGWCAAADIANTAPLAEFLELIGKRRGAATAAARSRPAGSAASA